MGDSEVADVLGAGRTLLALQHAVSQAGAVRQTTMSGPPRCTPARMEGRGMSGRRPGDERNGAVSREDSQRRQYGIEEADPGPENRSGHYPAISNSGRFSRRVEGHSGFDHNPCGTPKRLQRTIMLTNPRRAAASCHRSDEVFVIGMAIPGGAGTCSTHPQKSAGTSSPVGALRRARDRSRSAGGKWCPWRFRPCAWKC